MEFQDLACEIATSGAFPLKVAPFSIDDLKCRLPMQFDIHPVDASSDGPSVNDAKLESQLVLINQVTERQSAQVDVGFGTSSQATSCTVFGLPQQRTHYFFAASQSSGRRLSHYLGG
jgi:hypothetical protein